MKVLILLGAVATFVMYGQAVAAGQNAVPAPSVATGGQTVTLQGDIGEAAIPESFRGVPDMSSYTSLDAALKSRGTLRLDRATLQLSRSNAHVISADSLQLVGSTIWTGGADLTIYVRNLSFDNPSAIRTFKSAAETPDDPTNLDGNVGTPGAGGGTIKIYVLGGIDGLPRLVLRGQNGGAGETGAPGANGKKGNHGRNAKERYGFCKSGPGDGSNGQPGGQGGNGGDGGAGGDGGQLIVYYVNTPQQVGVLTNADWSAGQGGAGATGGAGGSGGAGGAKGGGNNACGYHAYNGRRGDDGAAGTTGVRGVDGLPGAGRVEDISLP